VTDSAPFRRPTITDVARRAGVSHQTVSRYLRFSGGLKETTVDRIEAAIQELNYRPNLIARSMRTRRTGRLAVLMPSMAFNPARMLAGAVGAAHQAGYMLDVLSFEGGATARTERLIELADSGQVEGILSLAPVLPSGQGLLPTDAPIVVSADFDDEMRGIGELADGSPVAAIIEHLVALGHRRFYHVAGSLQFASARARKQTYLDTVERLGLESLGVFDGDWSGESGVTAVLSLPAGCAPVAVIAANDLVAAGVIRGAAERGWSVPGDVSVTGWDNNPIGSFLSPPLATVDLDLERIGRNAMTRLTAMLRGEEPILESTPLNRIIWRDSVGKPSRTQNRHNRLRPAAAELPRVETSAAR
jgi:DNA-binding LacI/PurR family transcriptional regulator